MTEEKNKGGRPPVILTPEQIEQVEKLSATLNISQIADFFGIGEATFHEIKKRQPEVSVAYKKGKSQSINNVAKSLIQKATDGDTSSMIFYLKTQAGWSDKSSLDITSSDGSMTPKANNQDAIIEALKRKYEK